MGKAPEYKEKLDAWIDAHREEMIEDLKTLVRINSIRGEAKEGMPYGEGPAAVIAAMQKLMESYGLSVTNYENYCVTGDLDGAGEKALDILAHLDVVPVSEDWTVTKPFEPLVVGDRIYGRGTCDDKGPGVAALYAVRAVKELGFPLKRGVRLVYGSDEECGSSDLEYYYSKEKEAEYTFSPDADFPLINIEKARLSKTFCAESAQEEALPALLRFEEESGKAAGGRNRRDSQLRGGRCSLQSGSERRIGSCGEPGGRQQCPDSASQTDGTSSACRE